MNELTVPELSVILPAYNEGKVIEGNLNILIQKLDDLGLDYEIIIVNDGSKDDTLEKITSCKHPRVKILSYAANRGKGFAVRYGVNAAVGRYILFMDVDLSTDLGEINKFMLTMRPGFFDVIIGNRKIDLSFQLVQQPFYRRFLGGGFAQLSSLTIGHRFLDFTCGFKMFTSTAAKRIFSRQRIFNWAFDTELIYIALLQGFKIHEIPVIWRDQGDSKVRLGREILSSLVSLMQIRINGLKGVYRS